MNIIEIFKFLSVEEKVEELFYHIHFFSQETYKIIYVLSRV